MSAARSRLRELLCRWSFREGEFTLASGRKSRWYVDVRKTSLTGEGSALIGDLLVEEIDRLGWEATGAGGMTLGADPLTTALGLSAWRRGRPLGLFLVRKEPKGHGTGRQVELGAQMEAGAKVVILEDTTTTGGSSLRAVRAATEAGLDVVGVLTVVDRQEGAAEMLSAEGIPFASLFTVQELRG